MRQMVHFSIRVPRRMKAQVERVAKAAGHRSAAKVIREIIRLHFQDRPVEQQLAVARRVAR